VAPPPGWANIGDAQSDVLANGTFMLAQACQNCTSENGRLSTEDALFNASGLSWTVIPGQGKNDPNDEEGWTLLPSGQLLTVDAWLTPTTELFTPTSLSWSFGGNTVSSPVNSPAVEVGPQPPQLTPKNSTTLGLPPGTVTGCPDIVAAVKRSAEGVANGLGHAGRRQMPWMMGRPDRWWMPWMMGRTRRVARGRLGGTSGGSSRAENLTDDARRLISAKGAAARWKKASPIIACAP